MGFIARRHAMNELFVHKGSIVRKIWGRVDTVLLIFAGASAEFALNKAVDWLYYTGRLPADPLSRLFSTVRYAQEIVFAEKENALAAIDRITAIHKGVESWPRRPYTADSAYLDDSCSCLIDYSIRSFELFVPQIELIKRKMEMLDVFYRVGSGMGLKGLLGQLSGLDAHACGIPVDKDLVCSAFTTDLYRQYRRSLGPFRYSILLQVQVLLTPLRVRRLLALRSFFFLYPVLSIYRGARFLGIDGLIKAMLLPAKYKAQIAGLGPAA